MKSSDLAVFKTFMGFPSSRLFLWRALLLKTFVTAPHKKGSMRSLGAASERHPSCRSIGPIT